MILSIASGVDSVTPQASNNSCSRDDVSRCDVVRFATLDVRQLPLACQTGFVLALGGPSAACRTRTGADLSAPYGAFALRSSAGRRPAGVQVGGAPWQREGYRTSAAQGGVRRDSAERRPQAVRGQNAPCGAKRRSRAPLLFLFLRPAGALPLRTSARSESVPLASGVSQGESGPSRGARRPLGWGFGGRARPFPRLLHLYPSGGVGDFPSGCSFRAAVAAGPILRKRSVFLGGLQPAKVRYAVPYFCLNLRLRHGYD